MPPQNHPSPTKPILTIPLPSTTSFLLVRPWLPTDATSLVRHADNSRIPVNMRNSFPSPYTLSAANWWINHCLNSEDGRAPPFEADDHGEGEEIWRRRWWCDYAVALVSSPSSSESEVKEDLGEFIGAIGLKFNSTTDVHGQTAEVGYWLGEEYWGRGWMTLVVNAFVEWTWRTWDACPLLPPTPAEAGGAKGDAATSTLTSDAQLEGAEVNTVTTKWKAKGIDRLEAAVYAWNGCGSDRVLEKCGFEKEGVMKGKVWKVVDGSARRGDLVHYGLVRP